MVVRGEITNTDLTIIVKIIDKSLHQFILIFHAALSSSNCGGDCLKVSTNVVILYVKKPTSIGITSGGIAANLGTATPQFISLESCKNSRNLYPHYNW